jgi:hypothetical protein
MGRWEEEEMGRLRRQRWLDGGRQRWVDGRRQIWVD